jgi:hypothetical protein
MPNDSAQRTTYGIGAVEKVNGRSEYNVSISKDGVRISDVQIVSTPSRSAYFSSRKGRDEKDDMQIKK